MNVGIGTNNKLTYYAFFKHIFYDIFTRDWCSNLSNSQQQHQLWEIKIVKSSLKHKNFKV